MTDSKAGPGEAERPEGAAPDKSLTPAARRALAEAAERRHSGSGDAPNGPKEIQGPPGPEPTRYGDWAFKGRVTDF